MDIKTKEIVDFAKRGKIEKGVLRFPVLYSMTKAGKYRSWQVVVGIAKEEVLADRSDTDGAWLAKVKFVPVTEDLIARGDLPEGARGIYWTVSGQEGGKTKISKPTYVEKGTNAGKKNYTTAFTAAIRKTMTLYNKKIKDGNSPKKDHLKARDHKFTFEELMREPGRGDTPWRVFPMAFKSIGDPEDIRKNDTAATPNLKHIKFPAYMQPKYDGTRLLVVSHPMLPEIDISDGSSTTQDGEKPQKPQKAKIDAYSRGRETSEGNLHILRELAPVLKKFPGLYLDGELWKEGYSLQDISGSSRRTKDSKTASKSESIKLDFNVFDAFYVDKPDMPFEERIKLVEKVFLEMGSATSVKKVPTVQVKNKKEMLELYDQYVSDAQKNEEQLEGGMVRNRDSPYEMGTQKEERTYKSLKIKPREDAEYEIKGYTEGKGKNRGALIWIIWGPEPPKDSKKKRKTASVTPNWTDEKRDQVFKLFEDDPKTFEHFKGQEAVIQYSTLSNDDMPQQPKFLRFRKPELDTLLNDLLAKKE